MYKYFIQVYYCAGLIVVSMHPLADVSVLDNCLATEHKYIPNLTPTPSPNQEQNNNNYYFEINVVCSCMYVVA